ncbi:hypothetical protein [Streptomyces alkaliterrae]|uniref:Cellulose synthase n=1 Tax=Streptomyces alkaliterrae TaxID=2213162 RepID=A0A5P0YTL0_9ACTN|nr:hypothetical protein [Streptomyces alkaliterrae]MBB1260505.1 hypothetical protein [Streptomyces alkaliterrae]MQS02772.1 hypothetical protein [Streptomyces alkaliterrae]
MLTITVCAALSAAGLAVSFLTAYRRRFVKATRLAAISLLPIGLAMAGLIGLGGKVIQAFSSWAADLVFKPTVWAGFAVLALAVVLYLVAGFAQARSGGGTRREPAEDGGRPAAPPAASPPALRRGGGREAAPAGEDFSDIEAILKKHGI